MHDEDQVYMAEDDARTLMRAEEIKRDASRLRKAKEVAKKKADEASKVASL
jgi:membrane protein involved in colicin uptake